MSTINIMFEKEIARNPSGGTPYLYFDKKLFDTFWGSDDRIPVIVQIVSKDEIRIIRKSAKVDIKPAQPQPSDSEVITGRFELPVKDAITILNRIQETIENTIKEKKALGEDVSNLVELSNKIRAILEGIASFSPHPSGVGEEKQRGETQ